MNIRKIGGLLAIVTVVPALWSLPARSEFDLSKLLGRNRCVEGAGGRRFRAFDKATGAVLWETELPAGTTGAPMTYMFEGKQYLLVAIGSVEHDPEYIALSLP